MRHTTEEIECYLNFVNEMINDNYKLKLIRYNGNYHIEVYEADKLKFCLFDGTKNEVYYMILAACRILELK